MYARHQTLQGIEGIRKVFLREAKRTRLDLEGGQGFVTDNEWVLDTEGAAALAWGLPVWVLWWHRV
jgi:hypothetical protein